MSHTPGPWEAERVYLTIEDPTMRITAHGGALYVAEAAYSHIRGEQAIHVTDADEMRANARLIAAAPELLSALQNMVGMFDNPIFRRKLEGDWLYPEAIASARAAIAKATGADHD